jgi:hypothetical protein
MSVLVSVPFWIMCTSAASVYVIRKRGSLPEADFQKTVRYLLEFEFSVIRNLDRNRLVADYSR